MSKKSSKPSAKPAPSFAELKWRMIGLVVGGVCFVGVAALVGRFTDLSPKLKLDVAGERIQGMVESTGDGVYRLRYKHPGGDIHSCRYTGGFGLQPVEGEASEITVAFAMDRPDLFQPAGVSYIPAGITGLLFVAGMSCVLHARHVMVKMRVGAGRRRET
jgi:hypothetical protein